MTRPANRVATFCDRDPTYWQAVLVVRTIDLRDVALTVLSRTEFTALSAANGATPQ
jgi:hypothetical protein